MVFLFAGTLAELRDASHPSLPHGYMLLPAPAALPECSAPSVPHEQGTVLVGCLALPPGRTRYCVKAAGCPTLICFKSHKLLRKASFPAQQKVSVFKESTGTVFINQNCHKESILINIIILFERSSPYLTDTFQTKDAGCHSQS